MLDEPRDALFLLQRWYLGQCNAVWEHEFGIRIGTLDNPGWSLTVDLAGTDLGDSEPRSGKLDRSEHDWVHWGVKDKKFDAACGPTNLNEAILTFLDLSGAHTT